MNDNDNKNESENESESDNENDDNNNNNNNNNENEDENENEDNDDCEIKKINDYFRMIDKSISSEDQINLLNIMDDINRYWHMSYYDDNKDLNLKNFKLKCAFLSNDLNKMLFVEIFGHVLACSINR